MPHRLIEAFVDQNINVTTNVREFETSLDIQIGQFFAGATKEPKVRRVQEIQLSQLVGFANQKLTGRIPSETLISIIAAD